MNGPTQTGLLVKLLPSLANCVGESTIPAGVARIEVRGEYGLFRWITTVDGPAAVTVSIGSRLLATLEPGRVRPCWIVASTACGVNGVPSLNTIPLRSGIV